MADSLERKLSTKLSLFVSFAESFSYSHSDNFSKSPSSRSPKSFDDGAVGLGIVAAMIGSGGHRSWSRSDPIPIFSVTAAAKPGQPIGREEDEKMEVELSESYTCVISHVGGNSVRKRVYTDDGPDGIHGGECRGNPAVFFNSPPPVKLALPLPAADFLSCCYLCQKKLHGLDIFMYRGEKAFCSAECRCQQILSDEHGEKCGSEALKQFDCVIFPCSAAPIFSASIAAA